MKNYKNKENNKILQEIYDFNFRQIELNIREIGYGDQSINKNERLYQSISQYHFWDTFLNEMNNDDKTKKISLFLQNFNNINDLVEYFDEFNNKLSKKLWILI